MRNISVLMAALVLIFSAGCKAETATSPAVPDISCQTDADCTVKNVENCCGYYPACVNIDAVTDPEAVSRRCTKDGMASICGFTDISSCACVDHKCQPAGHGGGRVAQ